MSGGKTMFQFKRMLILPPILKMKLCFQLPTLEKFSNAIAAARRLKVGTLKNW